jgi:competence ComEA-like helix-hairpin-helix protein
MWIGFASALALSMAAALRENSSPDAKEKATFNAVCGSCHSTSLVEGLRTQAEWREEVDQMIKIGARGTNEQFDSVMRYLVRTLTKVNVNTAEAPEIAPVLDVTDAVAASLVKYRAQNGPFKTIEDLKQVSGLDPAKLNERKDRIVFR